MFYYIYRSFVKINDKSPVSSSSFVLAIIQLFIASVLVIFMEVVFRINLIEKIGKYLFIIIYFLLVFLNMGILQANKKYLKVCELFENLSAKEHKRNWKVILSIMIGSFFLVLLSGFLKATFL